MAAQPRGQSFVSANQLQNKKDALKSHLKKQLEEEKLKQQYRQQKEERKKTSGDDRWLNPLLDERLKKESHKKKDKKDKKKKKKKKKKREGEKNKQSDSDNSDDEWIENPVSAVSQISQTTSIQQAKPELHRDSWMENDPFSSIFSHTFNKIKEDKKPQEEDPLLDKPGSHPNELNPYWKDGGKGLPIAGNDNNDQESQVKNSWIHRAYNRLKEQAVADGISIEDAVIKKWGSMKKLQRLLDAAKSKSSINERKEADKRTRNERGWSTRTNAEPTSIDQPVTATEAATTSDSDESTDSEGDDQEIQPLTEEQKNELGARILRAELMGDDETAASLRKRLDAAETATRKTPLAKNIQDRSENMSTDNVLLTTEDRHGNIIPVHLDPDKIEDQAKRKRKKKTLITTHGDDGKRVRYFEDDDATSLQSMVRQERLESGDDAMARFKKYQANQRLAGDDILDDMFESASAIKTDKSRDEKRKRDRAITKNSKAVAKLERCRYCMGSSAFEKHLLITIGRKVCLAVPSVQSLVEGHCLLYPIEHVSAITYADEDVLDELREFKQALTKLFNKEGEDVVFLENFRSIKGNHHATIECIPISQEAGDSISIYFKKALLESDSEWSQNKKVIDVKSGREGGVKRAVPKGLPYFAVEFAMDGGFAHIIEDENRFSPNFGKEIIGGILDLEPRLWRHPPKESFERHKKKVLDFIDKWKLFEFSKTA